MEIRTLEEAKAFMKLLHEQNADLLAANDKLNRLNGATMKEIRARGSLTWEQYRDLYAQIYGSPPPN